MSCRNKFINCLLALTFVFPFPLFAQQSPEPLPDSAIPVFFFLHHTTDIALGILAVTPFDEKTLLWAYSPLASTTHALVAGPTSDTGNGNNFDADAIAVGTDYIDGSASTVRTFDGLIDDVRIWNTALSTSTLDTNWKTALQGNETNLIAYYKLDNAYTDSTANSYNLTAVNNPAFSSTVPFNTGSGGGALTTYYYNTFIYGRKGRREF